MKSIPSKAWLGAAPRAAPSGQLLSVTVTEIASGSMVLTNQIIKLDRSLATNGSVGF